MRFTPNQSIAALALAVAILLGGGARAEAQTSEERAATQRLFAEGVEASRAGRWEQARAAFERAFAIVPNPTILVNLAAARRQTGHLAQAYDDYQAVLRDRQATVAHREVATSALAELELLVPRIRVSLDGWRAGDRFELDGEVIEDFDSSSALRVDDGRHEVAILRGDERLGVTSFVAEVGAETMVRIVLPTVSTPALPPVSAPPAPEPTDLSPIFYGAGITGLVVGAGLFTLVGVAYGFDSTCAMEENGYCAEAWRVPTESAVAYSILAGAALVAGVTFVVLGATQGGGESSDSAQATLRLGPTSADLRVRW